VGFARPTLACKRAKAFELPPSPPGALAYAFVAAFPRCHRSQARMHAWYSPHACMLGTPLTRHAARFYVCELICALDHIHAVGVVYRDLKPENILLETSGYNDFDINLAHLSSRPPMLSPQCRFPRGLSLSRCSMLSADRW